MKKYFTSTSNSLSFSNQLFEHFKKTANSFQVGVVFLVLVCLNFSSFGQTTLSAGDLALLGINSANPDQFSIVLLKSISANTVINFTDNGFTGTNTGRTGEGFLTYTSPSSQNAGTVLTWTNGMTIIGTGWSSNNPSNFAFNGSGDQLFIFQGSTANWATQTGIVLLHGINYGIALSSTSGASNTLQPSTTLLPSTSFLNLPTSTNANGYFANGSTAVTSLNICGSSSALLALTVDPLKWIGTSSTAAVFPIFNNSIASAFTTTYGTTSTIQTFAVFGAGLIVDLMAIAPTGFEVSSDGTTYNSTATFTQISGSASGSLRIRLAANAAVTGSYNSQNIVLSSTGATSLNITTASSGNVVTAKALTITTPTASNKVYDGTNSATITGTLSGIVGSDVVTLNGTGTFSQSTVGTNLVVTSTSTLSGANASNYSLTQPTGLMANITQKSLTITTPTASNKVYDGTNSATITGTLSGIVGSDVVTLNGTGTFSQSTVGTNLVVTSTSTLLGANASNYSLTQPTGLTANITQKSLTITTPTASNKVYDGTNSATITGTLSGIVGSDVVTLNGTGTFSQSTVGTNLAVTSTSTLSGANASNYLLTQPTGLTANITQKSLTITTPTASNKVYDGTTAATITGTLSGIVGSDVVTFNGTGTFSQSTVGTNLVVTSTSTLLGTDGGNYLLTQPIGLTANITAKDLSITGLTANNKVYDGTTEATLSGTASLVGVIAADVSNVILSGTPMATFAQSSAGTGIAVTVTGYTISGSGAGNYSLAQPTGLTADITALGSPVINSVLTASVTYGVSATTYSIMATNSPTSFNATGLPDGLTINTTTGEIMGTPTSVAGSPFSVTISATNVSGTGTATLVYTINKKALIVSSPLGINKVYDRNNFATISGTLTGKVGADMVTLNGTGTFAQVNVGTNISITSTSTLAGADASNYVLTQPMGLTANILVKNLTAANAVADNKVYDANATATISGSTLVDVISPDDVSVSGNGTFASVDVANGIAVNTFLTLAGANAGNYSLTQPIGLTANITSKSLTLPGLTIANRAYDGTVDAPLAGSLALNGIINSDAVFISAGSFIAIFDNKNFGMAKPVTVTGFTLGGAQANNYSLSVPTGLTANITAKALTVTGAVASNKIYDGNTSATITGSTLVGVINPDNVTITQSGTFVQSNVGNGIAVTSTATILGADVGNYSLTQPTGLSANITDKPLTITGVTANNKNYDGTTTATLSGVATAALAGIVSGDEPNVTLGGTPIANFAQSAVGTAVAVTVTGFTISGTVSGNYSLTQPTGLTANIIAVPAPVINSSLTASTTYGTVSSTYVITATNSPTSFNATGLPAGLKINTSTGEITGTPTSIIGSPFSITISATNNGGTGTATLIYTINQKVLTFTAPLANNKIYDKTNVVTISGTLNGIFGSDVVILNGTGTFSQVNVGTNLVVTSTSTLSGTDATKYTLTQPTGLTANITTKPLTITGLTARNKYFDGTTTAILSAISALNGVIMGDVVTLGGTASFNFAQSAVGSGIAIIVTGYTITGASATNYSLTQPTGLTANITTAPTLTEVILPHYIQGVNGTNSNRIPFAYRASVNGLFPNTAYRYYNGVELTTASLSSVGAGNNIFTSSTQTNNFTYSTGPSLSSAGNYGTFTTDATGAYSGWFIIAPSGNGTRFVPGTNLYTRIILVDEAATYSSTVLSSTNTIKVINLVNASGANNGTGLRGNSGATDKNFVFVYDNTSGTGRPLSGTFVENDGVAETPSFASFYTSNVDGIAGAYGVVIPNTNENGIRRIEQRDFSTGAIAGCAATDDDGVWASGANTVNPTGGITPIVITVNDAPLNSCQVFNVAPTIAINVASTSNYVDGGVATNILSSYSLSGVINDPTDPGKTLGIDFAIGDAETAVSALTVTVSSSNLTVVPTANLVLTGTGAARNLKITPAAVGYSTIMVSVNDGSITTSFIVNYAASAASSTPANSHYLTGKSDASTAIVIDADYMLVGDDEDQKLRLYNRNNSGLPVSSFDFSASLNLTQISAGVPREVDIEAATRVGNSIFWMGSESNAADNGNSRPNRNRIFKTDIAGTGINTTLTYVSRYDFMKDDIIAWDVNNTHGKGANYYGLASSATAGVIPESTNLDGYNIEGLEMAPNNTTAYITFRAPQIIPSNRTKALIIPVTNFTTILSSTGGTANSATFGTPIELNLDGRGIREIRKNANNEYLIIAGASTDGIALKDFRLYAWTGNPNDAPVRLSTDLTGINADGSFESIVEVPAGLTTGTSVQLLLDSGGNFWYGDAIASKDLSQLNFQKFRAETVTLGDASLKTGTISNATLCENSTFSVPFTINETFVNGNVFTAQLSDNTGSFLNPSTIGTFTGTTANTISVTIPNGQTLGSAYRIRVISSNPSITGTNNGVDLSVIAKVTPTFTAVSPICAGAALAALPTTSNNGITGSWSPALDNTSTTLYTFTPDAGQCASSMTLIITVNPQPASPTNVSVNTTICSGYGVVLSATCATGSSPIWYENNEVTPLASTNIPILTLSSTFKVRCETALCNSAFSSVTITVNSPITPNIPEDVVVVPFGTSVTLQANGCNGTVNWYNNSGVFVNMPISPKCSDYYFAQCVVSSGGVSCTSPSSRKVYLKITHPFEVTSIISGGNWEDAGTWSGNRIPQIGDLVIIDTAHTVFIISDSAKAQCLELRNNAVLNYSNPSSKLSVGF